MGLTFLVGDYLFVVTAGCLAVSVAALGFRADRRRGYGPFFVGLLAGALLLAGKFVVESDAAVSGAVALLVGASVWNAWPKRSAPEAILQFGRLENGDEA
jgi:hypothetical protein